MRVPLAVLSPSPHHHHQHHKHNYHHQEAAAAGVAKRTTTTAAATTARASSRRRNELMAAGAGAGGGSGVVRLEIYMDLLCPWSFIEKHSLEKLIDRYTGVHPGVQFEIIWKPYFISRRMKASAIDKRAMYERAFGENFLTRIQTLGAKHDIAFSLRGHMGNSSTAHKLVALALQELGPVGQSHVLEQVFQGHFEDGRDLTDEEWLVSLGVAAGLPEGMLRLELEDEDAGRRIDAMAEAAREVLGVEAVPTVMVQGRYKVGGFQESEVFENLFEKMRLAGEF